VEGDDGALETAAAGELGMGHRFLAGCLGLITVPITVFGSVLALFSWLLSIALSSGAERMLGAAELGVWLGGAIALGSLVLGTVLTAYSVRPLRPLFRDASARGHLDLVGEFATVTTLRVDEGFGQAELDDGSLLQVRAAAPSGLTRGSRALIVDYDRRRGTFRVVPMDGVMGEEWRTLEPPA
jgi:hypothetical protein